MCWRAGQRGGVVVVVVAEDRVWLAYPEAASSSIRQLAAIIIIDKRHSARHDMYRRRRTEGKGRKVMTNKKWKDTEHGGDVGRYVKRSRSKRKRDEKRSRERKREKDVQVRSKRTHTHTESYDRRGD